MNINYENVKAAYYRGQNILKIYSGSTLEWEYETEPVEQTTKQIWYNSVSGDVVEPYAASAIGTVVSNTAYESKCVLEFASDVTAICANAFSGCTDLEYVSLPVSATSIGDNAFDGCSSLDDIYMPSVQSIGRESFKDCAFTAFTVPTSVTAITADAFKGVAIEEFNYNGTKAQWSGITYGDFWDEDTWITNVIHCSDGDIELYQYDYSKRYLEFVATSGGTFQFSGSSTANTISYSTDQGKTWSTPAQVATVNVNSGDSVMWKGEMTPNTNNGIGVFSGSTASFDAQGNTMSLLYGENYKNQTSLSGKYCAFKKLMKDSKVVNAENMKLPATVMVTDSNFGKNGCYQNMFDGCTSLITPPQLPATTLSNACYQDMFNGCTSLTIAPSLPATTSVYGCYNGMFRNCTSLRHTPSISITTIGSRSGWSREYGDLQEMFKGCTSLETADFVIPSTQYHNSVFQSMFQGCTSLTTVPQFPATSLSESCYQNMFNGCTSLTQAPSLPATTLAQSCYNGMFANCSSLTTAPVLSATTLASNCYESMFSNCTQLTQAPQLNASAATQNCYRNMFNGCTSLTQAPQLPAITVSTRSYEGMFRGCTSLTTAPSVLPATTANGMLSYSEMFMNCTALTLPPSINLNTLGYYGTCAKMFNGCTSLTTAPVLSATTLTEGCYSEMFRGCTNLNYIKMLATDISASNCLNYWVYGVANSGTFVKNVDMTTLPTGESGIPNGWTVEDFTPTHDYSQDYFTIVAKEDGEIQCGGGQYYDPNEDVMGWCEIEYSTDNGETWAVAPYEEDDGPSRITFNVQSGDTIMLKYDATNLYDNPDVEWYSDMPCLFNNGDGSAQFEVQGNIMSLIYGDDFTGNTSLVYNEREIKFGYMFSGNEMLVSAENLVLPSETLNKCYDGMFSECYSLIKAPSVLPATTLVGACYYGMFRDCPSLTQAPELPATTLTTEDGEGCYQELFQCCTNLNYIKMLATDISAENCLDNWVYNVAQSGTFVKNANATIPTGDSGIPNGWSVQNA